jgi:vacuolar protein sorting-associated protein 52
MKALIRIRDFLVDRIRSLRVPNSNVQVIQQSTMLRYRALFHFMLEHHTQLANEIRQAYTNTMKWYYNHHFERFKKTLDKVKIENKVDMLGNDESSKGGLFSSGKKGSLSLSDPFQLGDRVDILKSDELVSIQAKDLEKPVIHAKN